MFQRLRNLFKRTTRVLEVPIRPIVRLTDEIREAIASLDGHPGWEYLMSQLSLQQAALAKELQTAAHKDIRAVDHLQSGIFWTGWLEVQARKLAGRIEASRPVRELTRTEQQLLDEIRANFTIVGREG